MKIVVINLATEGARWKAAKSEFAAVGLHAVRQPALVGEALSEQRTAQLYSKPLNRRQYHRGLRPGEIGCYASHLAVWQDFLLSRERCIAIFEDDVEISSALPRVLDAVARLPQGCDLIKLIGRPVETPISRSALLSDHWLIEYRRVPSLTGAYVLTRRGAEKLVAARHCFGRPVDVDMRYWWECDLRVMGVQPYPAGPAFASRYTTIEGRRERPDGAAGRLRKIFLQVRYTVLNWYARQTLRPLPTPAPATLPARQVSLRKVADPVAPPSRHAGTLR